MIDKELFVTGVWDRKSGYRQLWHIGEYKDVNHTYEASCRGANSSGLNKDYIFVMPYPPDDEVVEKFKLTREFLQWLNETAKPLIK